MDVCSASRAAFPGSQPLANPGAHGGWHCSDTPEPQQALSCPAEVFSTPRDTAEPASPFVTPAGRTIQVTSATSTVRKRRVGRAGSGRHAHRQRKTCFLAGRRWPEWRWTHTTAAAAARRSTLFVSPKGMGSRTRNVGRLQTPRSQDRDAVGCWIEGQADRAEDRRILAALPRLIQGNGCLWVPSDGVLAQVDRRTCGGLKGDLA